MPIAVNAQSNKRYQLILQVQKFSKDGCKLDVFRGFILQCIDNGYSKSKTVKAIYEHGYDVGMTDAFDYLKKIKQEYHTSFEPQPYVRTMSETLKYKTGSKGRDCDYITRNGVFNYL